MKVNELEIGDIVLYEGRPMRVTSLYAKEDKNEVGLGDEKFFWRDASELTPIPITKELLAANGWDASAYSTLKIDDSHWLDYYHYEHRLRRWWNGIDEWQNHAEVKELCFQCGCMYLHELQHALRMQGQYDLADSMTAPANIGKETA